MNRIVTRTLSRYKSALTKWSIAQSPLRHASTSASSRIERLEGRLPPFLRGYLGPLRNAPISHITAFAVLHEITAVVPLVGLAATFHYTNWLPPYVSEWAWVQQGIERFGRYLRKKGWISSGSAELAAEGGGLGAEEAREGGDKTVEGGARLVLEVATAWAVTKALLPVRLIACVWATPWFARVFVLPVTKVLVRLSGTRGRTAATSGAAGTGAVGGGVVDQTPAVLRSQNIRGTSVDKSHPP